jgi:hypothetical protein
VPETEGISATINARDEDGLDPSGAASGLIGKQIAARQLAANQHGCEGLAGLRRNVFQPCLFLGPGADSLPRVAERPVISLAISAPSWAC